MYSFAKHTYECRYIDVCVCVREKEKVTSTMRENNRDGRAVLLGAQGGSLRRSEVIPNSGGYMGISHVEYLEKTRTYET